MPLGYVVLDREAGEFFLRSRSLTFPGMKIAEIFGIDDGPLFEEIRRNILHLNGADHGRLRGLVNPAFTPRAVERYRPAMRAILGELVDRISGAGRCEFVGAIAKPYPSAVIATVMGAPLEDAGRLWDWSNLIQRQFGMTVAQERPAIERAVEEFYAYAGELLERRRATPGDDLISSLIAAEQDGDRLSDVELLNLVLNVLVGGVDTTQSQLAHAARLFAEHPDQWRLLAREPGLAAQAAEEVLRFEPITPFTARVALEDVDYRGVTFPEGTVVLVCASTGNREADAHEAPDRFDITVPRGQAKPMTFGAGPHYCLGANLARAELQEALVLLSRRLPALTLDGRPVYGSIDGIYGLERLPIRFGAP
jgi:cytochrome P450